MTFPFDLHEVHQVTERCPFFTILVPHCRPAANHKRQDRRFLNVSRLNGAASVICAQPCQPMWAITWALMRRRGVHQSFLQEVPLENLKFDCKPNASGARAPSPASRPAEPNSGSLCLLGAHLNSAKPSTSEMEKKSATALSCSELNMSSPLPVSGRKVSVTVNSL